MDSKDQIFHTFSDNPSQNWHQISDKKKEKWKFLTLQSKCAHFLLFLHLLLSFLNPARPQIWDGVIVTAADYQSLQAIKHELDDPKGFLRSWNDSGYGACSGGWAGIKCAQGQVIVIQLPWKGLGGRISEKMGQLQALRKLSLHDNQIGGSIPQSLGYLPSLRGVQLFNNKLSGSIPISLGFSPLLQNLDLSNNLLVDNIPDSIFNSTKLYSLNLSFNSLSGSIPGSLSRSRSLIFLSLDHNNLSGLIPESLGRLSDLQELELGNNQFDGAIPNEIGRLSRVRILDISNNAINGSLPSSFSNLSSLTELNLEGNNIESEIPEGLGSLKNLSVLNLRKNKLQGPIPAALGNISTLTRLDLSLNNVSGEIPASLAGLSHLGFLNVSYNNLSGAVPALLSQKFNSSSFAGNVQLCGYSASTPCPSEAPSQRVPPPGPETSKHRRRLSTKDKILIAAGVLLLVLFLLCCILLCCLIRGRAASKGEDGAGAGRAGAARTEKGVPAVGGEAESGGEAGGKLVHFDGPMAFAADDLLCATAEIMGKSTFGTVYKATLEDGSEVAVKRLREKITKSQREFETEVNVLGKIRHPNLLALRAYYLGPKGEKLLVFDYMPKGSLAAFLHARGPETPIDWPTRMGIAKGVARGLSYLHGNENIIHGNLTSSNVLLDEQNSAKISDYGLSRLMTAAANSNVIATAGALGYRAPELSKLKKANTKTDVYSLGVIILELLTGKSPGEPLNGLDLPQWVASIVKKEWTNEVFDLELMRDASMIGDELLNTLKLALHCVDPSPSARPEVQRVLQQLEEIRPETATSSRDD
ncbi:probable leucine-rich repeat receptor-like protein kinase IMK3 isoform X2 [Pyrus x bretschneideri]|uniref:probable leucine-rich repeat receptor-like protein kinase IMK3 isoform X1 n=1 Tax=Pyrus x bretschneideri TaxID=225117 RepID=UPI00202F2AF4|nr:probable leucine-rich repeat receptor-like protein kinase IMK3 isoform X1 [Pyrus x bretschneideri]XP_048446408.1 probable leucine-rich repeat receptor-like protein kinase IMK3 isoform X2 [Pyrus x bretschneideri]